MRARVHRHDHLRSGTAPAPRGPERASPARPGADPLRRLQRTVGNRAAQRLIGGDGGAPALLQARLAVGPPGDVYEQEAERVAERVVRGPERTGGAPGGEERTPPPPEVLRRVSVPGGGGPAEAPPIVGEALRQPGAPLDGATRAFMEPRLGVDLGGVRVHTGPLAERSAEAVGAQAYTVGRDIVFGAGHFSPASREGRRLLAHEVAHTIQQGSGGAAVQRQTRPEPVRTLEVVVVGSPGPGEVRANHPYQFAHAAASQGVDEDTLWLVERTGYEQAGVDLATIEQMASPGRVAWVTPERPVMDHLDELPAGSISSFQVFSHGVPGQVTLRYGWGEHGLHNYGISLPEVRSMRSDLFTERAFIRFDSCNTGTSDVFGGEGNLAQSFADQSGRPVAAWTGRTSYSDVNRAGGRGPAQVEASEVMRGGPRSFDTTEVGSQYLLGREPRLRVFTPADGPRTGGFRSSFEIRVRLPETRHFAVPAGGSVAVTCSNGRFLVAGSREETAEGAATGARRFQVVLRRSIDWRVDTSYDVRTFIVGDTQREVWSGLEEGTYYLDIWRGGNSNFLLVSDIAVDVHAARGAAVPAAVP